MRCFSPTIISVINRREKIVIRWTPNEDFPQDQFFASPMRCAIVQIVTRQAANRWKNINFVVLETTCRGVYFCWVFWWFAIRWIFILEGIKKFIPYWDSKRTVRHLTRVVSNNNTSDLPLRCTSLHIVFRSSTNQYIIFFFVFVNYLEWCLVGLCILVICNKVYCCLNWF